jgi:GNAT superfamily N-acetyltransferase
MQTSHVVSGLRLRPYGGEPDLADLVRIRNAEAEADDSSERITLEGMAADLSHPSESFDASRDVTIAEIEGRPVAVAWRQWVDTTDNVREYRLDGAVDPAWRRRGIGTLLHEDGARRSIELAASHATTRPRIFGSWSTERQPGDEALLRAAGFEPARWFFEMARPSLDDIDDIPLPDGLEVRPITRELARQVWLADIDAFQDHWGGFDHSDEHLERWLADPTCDLSLWVVAFDGEEVAAGIINVVNAAENEALGLRRGWLASVFTRRQWRKRGLATALIARSLGLLRDRGMTSAALGVDGDNPSGAFGLYERLGFEVGQRSTAWRKPFQP